MNRWLRTDFDCENDAKEALLRWSKKLKYPCLGEIEIIAKKVHPRKGRPKSGTPVTHRYRLKTSDQARIDSLLKIKGRFIIATQSSIPKRTSIPDSSGLFEESKTNHSSHHVIYGNA